MGRKNKQVAENDQSKFFEEIHDITVTLLDLCGLLGDTSGSDASKSSDDHSSSQQCRRQLTKALVNLQCLIQSTGNKKSELAQQACNQQTFCTEESISDPLLACENALSDIRTICSTLIMKISHDEEKAISTLLSIEAMARNHRHYEETVVSKQLTSSYISLACMARAMVSALQHRNFNERKAIRELYSFMDNFYSQIVSHTPELQFNITCVTFLTDTIQKFCNSAEGDIDSFFPTKLNLRESVRTLLDFLSSEAGEALDFSEHLHDLMKYDGNRLVPSALSANGLIRENIQAKTEIIERQKWKEDLVNFTSIQAAVHSFLEKPLPIPIQKMPVQSYANDNFTAFLLIGDSGSGKTYSCDQIHAMAKKQQAVYVIRPDIPLDLLGSTVGETENIIVAMFSAAVDETTSGANKVIILLDGLEHILLTESSKSDDIDDHAGRGRSESHMKRRSQSTFLSMLDFIMATQARRAAKDRVTPCEVLLVCTISSSVSIGSWSSRFDRVFTMEPPNKEKRRAMILKMFSCYDKVGTLTSIENNANVVDVPLFISDVVESTVGRSYAELMQHVRQALEEATEHWGEPNFECIVLNYLKNRLLSNTPASLRSGVLEDYVDMRVLNARDLGAFEKFAFDAEDTDFLFKGLSAANVWRELETSIVIPLCRSRELFNLTHRSVNDNYRRLTSGILLAGPAGSGKSALALHCARFAASLLPSVKLLDVSCTSLIHKEVGASEQAIHHLFNSARRAAPCIVLMDGIENIAAVRGNDTTTEGTLDRVLSTLLVELDGIDNGHIGTAFDSNDGSIAIIAITQNAAWIDPALKRPGRLDKVVCLDLAWT